MGQARGGSKRRLVRRHRIRRRSRVARRDADPNHGGVLLHGRRGPGVVVLIGHVSGSWNASSLILMRRHAIILLGSIRRIVGVHVVHVLRMLVLQLMLVIGIHVLLLSPSRAPHVSIQIHATVDASGRGLYALPSRQMAVTHPAGLGDRTVAGIAQCCDSRIYLHCRRLGGEQCQSRSCSQQLVSGARLCCRDGERRWSCATRLRVVAQRGNVTRR